MMPVPSIINGTIMISDDINIVMNAPAPFKILSLDEEGNLNPNLPNVIEAVNLLPPVDALIAESDGDEDLYMASYYSHLKAPYNYQFLSLLLAYLYKGGSFIIYAPHMNDTIHMKKFREIMWRAYGIGIGDNNTPFTVDPTCIPIWCEMLYSNNLIDPYTFMRILPRDAMVIPPLMQKLVIDISPYAETYSDAVGIISEIRVSKKPIRPLIHIDGATLK